MQPGRIAQSVGPLFQEGQLSVTGESMCTKYWLVNRLGGQSLPRKSVVRLIDRRDMTLDVYRGRKTTIQQQYNISYAHITLFPFFFQYWHNKLMHNTYITNFDKILSHYMTESTI